MTVSITETTKEPTKESTKESTTEPTKESQYIRSIFQTNTDDTIENTLTTLLLQWLETTSPIEWEVSP